MTGAYHAIEDHAVIGDLHTVALVATDGTIDWCCLPRFDSPAVFGSLLDSQRGGSFSVRCPAERTKQLYMPDSNVLVTRFLGANSVGEVIDFMVPHEGAAGSSWPHRLVRRLRAVRGTVEFSIRCAPAFDYGRVSHKVSLLDHGGAIFVAPGAEMVLRSTVPLSIDGSAAVASVRLDPDDDVDLILEWGGRIRPTAQGEADLLFENTLNYWRSWIRRSRYQGRYREMVERSALVLKLLVYQPTGALVAAPTTSLPETLGGGRNWDYRYTWIRDAAFTVYGLMLLGFMEEAAGFMSWLEARCREVPDGRGLQVLYTIEGSPEVPESILEHLEGYRGSRPVRVGNAAADQFQVDIYGELMDSVYLFNKHGHPIAYDLWVALARQLNWLESHWELPDDGIWETRGGRQRFTYSSLMTWVAFERATRIASQRGLPAPIVRWRDYAHKAYNTVQRDGWNPQTRCLCPIPGQ